MRRLATVATAEGAIERVPNPAPWQRELTRLRRLSRAISRSWRGSARRRQKERRARLQAHLAAIRRHEIHRLTTGLATTRGRIVVEGLDVTGMLRRQGSPRARRCRPGRGPAAAARQDRLGTPSGRVLMGAPGWGPRPSAQFEASFVGLPARGTP